MSPAASDNKFLCRFQTSDKIFSCIRQMPMCVLTHHSTDICLLSEPHPDICLKQEQTGAWLRQTFVWHTQKFVSLMSDADSNILTDVWDTQILLWCRKKNYLKQTFVRHFRYLRQPEIFAYTRNKSIIVFLIFIPCNILSCRSQRALANLSCRFVPSEPALLILRIRLIWLFWVASGIVKYAAFFSSMACWHFSSNYSFLLIWGSCRMIFFATWLLLSPNWTSH